MSEAAIVRCPLCACEQAPRTTTFVVDLEFGVVEVADVPALTCAECGESWIEDAVAEALELVVAKARCERVAAVFSWPRIV